MRRRHTAAVPPRVSTSGQHCAWRWRALHEHGGGCFSDEINWDEDDPDWRDDGEIDDSCRVQAISSAAELFSCVRDYAAHRDVAVDLDSDESCVVFDRL